MVPRLVSVLVGDHDLELTLGVPSPSSIELQTNTLRRGPEAGRKAFGSFVRALLADRHALDALLLGDPGRRGLQPWIAEAVCRAPGTAW